MRSCPSRWRLRSPATLNLLVDPVKTLERFYEHFLRFPVSLVFTLSFCGEDLDEVQRVLADFMHDMNPGAHLVDMFLVLSLLPDFSSPWCAEARKKGPREVEMRQFGLRILA
ncbi:hypothetical protein DFH08DRAFT_970172 [Mycena albidolilacea]|uniref:Uncharacterized protein n=1 Tax=Mycena albidolilacea TaxID=1033008 RepID=A0AAD6ZG00_9AGAR|nr:hypothetical protein DFH08DRAFT_970172 [Mycena albidolilacea]